MTRDRVLLATLQTAAAIVAAVVVVIAVFLLLESLPVLARVGPLAFVSGETWHPSSGRYNLLPMAIGTLLATAGAVLLAAPIGVLAAIFHRYYAPPGVRLAMRRVLELLAGIPSVVYGFWGLTTVVPLIAAVRAPGASLLAGIVVLAIMILPTIALLSDAALAQVPASYLRAAAALGLTRWGTVSRVAIPSARAGIATGVLLATARALGETMAVLMVCGNAVRIPLSPFDPMRTLTANVALEMAYAGATHRSALFVSGLLLLAMIAVLTLASHRIEETARVH